MFTSCLTRRRKEEEASLCLCGRLSLRPFLLPSPRSSVNPCSAPPPSQSQPLIPRIRERKDCRRGNVLFPAPSLLLQHMNQHSYFTFSRSAESPSLDVTCHPDH